MATNIHRVLDNFKWKLEGITLTNARVNNRLAEYDPLLEPIPQCSSAWFRRFYIEWNDSGEDGHATDSDRREAAHLFRLFINYPEILPHNVLRDLYLQDRHDIAKTLRAPASRLGYDASNTTTDIGLYHRKRVGDAMQIGTFEKVRQLVTDWRCLIREDEQ